MTRLLLTLLVLLTSTLVPLSARAADPPQNLIVIMTDNHGAWTLGCYGNKEIRTPAIDRLAAEGMLFTNAFAANPVCSPTRATFLTGLIPSQHGVHCFLRAGRLQIGPEARNTLERFTSIPEVLRDHGYRCGLVGKWHLGDNLRPQEGFDDYWVTMPHGATQTFHGAEVIENGQVRKEPRYLTDFWTDHAVNFLNQSKTDQRPFFLMLTYNGPYSLGRLLLQPGENRHVSYYADQELASFPHEPVHPWQYHNRDYHNHPVSARRVATEVSGVDDGVSTILKTLDHLGLAENTLVVFTADQGWAGGHGGFTGMGDHTHPLTARDPMMRIPLIVRHPGKIPAGTTSDLLLGQYDLKPTLLGYLGLGAPSIRDNGLGPVSPGQDWSAVLRGESVDVPEDLAIFMEFETLRAVRTSSAKLVRRFPAGPDEFFDLSSDPDERQNLIDDASAQPAIEALSANLDRFFNQAAVPQYDIWRNGGAQTVLYDPAESEEDPEPVSPPPLPEGFQQPQLDLPPGYRAELVAGPPLVAHPMMAGFDDRGRLFIAESAGLNLRRDELEKQLPNSIIRLEDRDHDGHFDTKTVFADKLTFPSGALWHQGSLYVTAAPHIWKFTDTDDDGVADERVALVSGFGYIGNAADLHGPFLGPEGRIYWCDGRHGHEFRDKEGNVVELKKGSYIFSCRPDGSDVRAHCGGGMDNPVEIDFTSTGEMLGTVNILDHSPRKDCLVHWLYGGAYPHYQSVLGEFLKTGDLLGPVHNFGHVAVSGMTRYRSGVLDPAFRDDLFVAIFNTGRVQRVHVEPDGATFTASEWEFLSSPSQDFHPTDVLEDADGSLLVVDTGGWFRIGCPTSQIAKPELMGGIYRIRKDGMPGFVDPRGLRLDLSSMNPRELVRQLGDTRFAVAEQAISECARRGLHDEQVVRELARAVKTADRHIGERALWALARIPGASAQAEVVSALSHPQPHFQQIACRALSAEPLPESASRLQQLLKSSDNPAIRREAATALGRIKSNTAVPTILDAIPHAVDRSEEHALIFALAEIGDLNMLQDGLQSTHPASRRACLILLNQLAPDRISEEFISHSLTTDHEPLRMTAANILAGRPEWSGTAARQIRTWLAEQGEAKPWRDIARPLLEQPDVSQVLGDTLADRSAPLETRSEILNLIEQAGSVTPHASWTTSLAAILHNSSSPLFDAAVTAAGSLKGNPFAKDLQRIVADEQLSQPVRLLALASLTRQSSKIDDSGIQLLLDLLASDVSGAARVEAARIIRGVSLSGAQLLALAATLPQAGPLEIHDLIQPFHRSRDVDIGKAFMHAVREAPGFWSLQPYELSDFIKSQPDEVRDMANPILAELLAKDVERRRRLDAVAAIPSSGETTTGRELFLSEKAKCSTCHRIGEQGGKIGPDLSRIGRIRSRRDLTEAILFPSASLVREYQPYLVVDTSGRIHTGLLLQDTDSFVELQPATGNPIRLEKSDIEAMKPSPISIMPDGLDRLLTDHELSQLVEYLSSLK